MPIFDYKCEICENEFEIMNLGDEDRKEMEPCPECGGPGKYKFTPSKQFELKGRGWPGKDMRMDA